MRLSQRRFRLGAIATVAVATGVGVALLSATIFGGPNSPEVRGSPDVEQVLEDLPHIREAIERGEPVTIIGDDPPAADTTPFRHGPFRIIPNGFSGELDYEEIRPAPADIGARPTGNPAVDEANARRSPLWHEPEFIPPGFTLVRAGPPELEHSGTNIGIELVFQRPDGAQITMTKRPVGVIPIDIGAHLGPESAFDFEFITMRDGRFAVLTTTKTPESIGGYRSIRVVDRAVNTIVFIEDYAPEGVSVADFIGMAEGYR